MPGPLAFTLCLVLAAAAGTSPQPEPGPRVIIHLPPAGGGDEAPDRRLELRPGASTLVRHEVELGNSVEGASVEVIGMGTEPLRLQSQHETSVTIMDEGPHLDLLDWRHFTSEWTDLERLPGGHFLVGMIAESERIRFPDVTARELRKAVRSAGGERWAELVTNASGPNDPPASVGVSTLRLRVVRGPKDEPEVLLTIEFSIPMGC